MVGDMMIEDQWFLEDTWRYYKVKKIYLKFQGIVRRKNVWKSKTNGMSRRSIITCHMTQKVKKFRIKIFQHFAISPYTFS